MLDLGEYISYFNMTCIKHNLGKVGGKIKILIHPRYQIVIYCDSGGIPRLLT